VSGSKVFYMNLDSDNGFPPELAVLLLWRSYSDGRQERDRDLERHLGQVPGGDSDGLFNGFVK